MQLLTYLVSAFDEATVEHIVPAVLAALATLGSAITIYFASRAKKNTENDIGIGAVDFLENLDKCGARNEISLKAARQEIRALVDAHELVRRQQLERILDEIKSLEDKL